MDSIRVVFISVPRDQANAFAKKLVEKRLAACINIVPRIESYFWWDDAVQYDEETLLIVKTAQERFDQLMTFVKETHPYDLPEVISVDVTASLPEYIEWVRRETASHE